MSQHTLLESSLAQHHPGRSLPQAFYNSDEIYRAEVEMIWQKHWLFAGFTAEIRRPGEWFTLQVGPSSILVVRDKANQVRAFYNTCRHRGSRICTAEKGSSATLTCPYHQWTYGLDGKLLFAKNMGEDFDRTLIGLKPVACEVAAGYIFISLAERPTDFSDFRGHVQAYLAPHNLDDSKVAFETTIVESGNWKLVLENNRECYHCATSHPELLRTISEFDGPTDPRYGGEYAEKCSADEARWRAFGLMVDPVDHDPIYRMVRAAFEKGESFTMSGRPASSKLMGSLPEQDVGALRLLRFPNTWNHALGDHAIAFRLLPLSATTTQLTTKWLVHKEAVEGVDYDLDALTEVWKATNAQDQRLVETNQLGINSFGYEPGTYSPLVESGVIAFTDWYVQAMREGLQESSLEPTGEKA
jgi:Rieske 2Fe-2S family protein